MTLNELRNQHCRPRRGTENAVGKTAAVEMLDLLPDWALSEDGNEIRRDFRFPDFHHTIAFVNAIAWIAHREDHHPDLEVGYGHCLVRYSTHDVGGLSLNDFICAARVDALA